MHRVLAVGARNFGWSRYLLAALLVSLLGCASSSYERGYGVRGSWRTIDAYDPYAAMFGHFGYLCDSHAYARWRSGVMLYPGRYWNQAFYGGQACLYRDGFGLGYGPFLHGHSPLFWPRSAHFVPSGVVRAEDARAAAAGLAAELYQLGIPLASESYSEASQAPDQLGRSLLPSNSVFDAALRVRGSARDSAWDSAWDSGPYSGPDAESSSGIPAAAESGFGARPFPRQRSDSQRADEGRAFDTEGARREPE